MTEKQTDKQRIYQALVDLAEVYEKKLTDRRYELLVQKLSHYPSNRVERVCHVITETCKFFPSVSELIDALEMDYHYHPSQPKVVKLPKDESIRRLIQLDMGEVTRHGTMEEYIEYIREYEEESGLAYRPMIISDSEFEYAKKKGIYPNVKKD